MDKLESFQNRTLKQIQGLPLRTSTTATRALLGILPIKVCIERNMINHFSSIARDSIAIDHEVAERQLAAKAKGDNSWFMKVEDILRKYDLPSSFELMRNPVSKRQWKTIVKGKVNGAIEEEWRVDITSKSSLKYINPEAVRVGTAHHTWSYVRNNRHDVRRAEIKARLLTGTYTLQANRARFNQFKVNPTCKLCKTEPEDREHLISKCTALTSVRTEYSNKLRALANHSDEMDTIVNNPVLLTQFSLDSSHPDIASILDTSRIIEQIELISREYIYRLHVERAKLLEDL